MDATLTQILTELYAKDDALGQRERECAALREQLAAAEARVVELEAQIATLHTVGGM